MLRRARRPTVWHLPVAAIGGAVAMVAALVVTASPAPSQAVTYTYSITTRGAVSSDVGVFASSVRSILGDDRGWSLGGSVEFVEVSDDADFAVILAAPAAVERAAAVCGDQYSCRVGREILINDDNWANTTPAWTSSLDEYRNYVVNHEVGHWLGFGHRQCPGSGQQAPVMQQQSIEVEPCVANGSPLPSERQALADSLNIDIGPVEPTGSGADVLWFESWKDGGSVTVGRSNGEDFVNAGQWISGLDDPDWAASGDVDGDGLADLVWYQEPDIRVALSDTSRFVDQGAWLTGFGGPDWAGLVDVNGDGLDDVLWYEAWNNGAVSVALSTGDGFDYAGQWLTGFGAPDWAGAGDADGDGTADLFWYEVWKNGGVTVATSTGGALVPAGQWLTGFGGPDFAAVDDTNGDGTADLFWYEAWNNGAVTVLASTGSALVNQGRWVTGFGAPDWAGVGDANGDGLGDLVWYEEWKDGTVTVLTSTGTGLVHQGAWLTRWGPPDWATIAPVG